jgi:hypothetical protein
VRRPRLPAQITWTSVCMFTPLVAGYCEMIQRAPLPHNKVEMVQCTQRKGVQRRPVLQGSPRIPPREETGLADCHKEQ